MKNNAAMEDHWSNNPRFKEALAEPEPRNQCAETCERAKLCAICAMGLEMSHPQPSKPWVGLTPEDKLEIEKIVGITEDDDGWMVSQMFTLTEAKLKGKNT